MKNLINCLLYEQELFNKLTTKVNNLKKLHNIVPNLATILVGNSSPSLIYIKNKSHKANVLGIKVENYNLDEHISEPELLHIIEKLNNNSKINGILLQLPLPAHLNTQKIISHINPAKDVDGLHPLNAGLLLSKSYSELIPCTPLGILFTLKKETSLQSKNVVIVGRSKLVGLPIALLMVNENATVTICNSYTKDLKSICQKADILIVAIGKTKFITKDYIKENSIVIDVGINRVPNLEINNKIGATKYSITGDVNIEEAISKNARITPVPNGIGKLTVTFLLYNTYKATVKQHNLADDSYDIFYNNPNIL